MKLINSLKRQVLVIIIGFTLTICTLYTLLAVVSAFFVEDVLIENLLDKQAHKVQQDYRATGQLNGQQLGFIQLYSRFEHMPDWLQYAVAQDGGDKEVFTADNRHYHYQPIQLSNTHHAYLVAEVSELLVVSKQPSILHLFILGLVITLIIAIALAYKLSSRLVTPIEKLADAVKNRQPQNPKPLPQLPFELGYLANTLTESLNGLQNALTREQAFTADVSHELRTPLTILSNTLTLVEQRGINQQDLADLQQINQQMHNTVAILLALARAESIHKEPCLLKAHCEQALLQLLANNPSELETELMLDSNISVTANPALLRLLLNNLLENALNHGAQGKLTITQQKHALIIENTHHSDSSANHIPDEQLSQPGVKQLNSQGIGQGLYLVNRIAQSFGWQCQVESTDTHFRVTLFILSEHSLDF